MHIVHKNKIRLNQWFVPVERSGSVSLLASIQSNLTPITAGSKEWNEECFGASQRSAVNSLLFVGQSQLLALQLGHRS